MTSITMNQMGVIDNRYQDYETYKRVVTVCSAGCLRSPTAAVVLAMPPFNHNTRAVGHTDYYAIVTLSPTILAWADEFVVMENHMVWKVKAAYKEVFDRDCETPIVCLDIPDSFQYRDPELMAMIKDRYAERTHHE